MIPVTKQVHITFVSDISQEFQESSISLGKFETKNGLGYRYFWFSADHVLQINLRCFVFCKINNRVTFTLQTIKQILGIYASLYFSPNVDVLLGRISEKIIEFRDCPAPQISGKLKEASGLLFQSHA